MSRFVVLALVGMVACEEQLLSVAVVFRHGDRTPTYVYPTDPYNETLFNYTQPGELTNPGKLSQLRLGQYLRDRYKDFLPVKYSKDDLYLISDDMDRCLMSAYSNLAGLYPPKGADLWSEIDDWQPIPVHINTYLLWGEPNECKKYEYMKEEIYRSAWMQAIDEENRELYTFLSNATGMDVNGIEDVRKIYQLLYIESRLDLKLPEWSQSLYPGIIEDLAALTLAIQTNNTEMAKFSAGPLLHAIIEKFEEKSLKMIMYSGHDTNVAQTIQAVAPARKVVNMGFSSCAILELWQIDGKEYVKVFLKRDEDVSEVEVKGCETNCTFGRFKAVLKDIAVDDGTWVDDCNSSRNGGGTAGYKPYYLVGGLCFILALIFKFI